jgi:uncharacterized protein YdaU (DUF1376 family)
MHYYPHHIGDFIKDTANLNDHQLATYLRMIWAYYLAETPITGTLEDIAFAMRSDEKTVQLLLRHYFSEHEDGWRHKRCDEVIATFREKGEKARESAKARWDKANGMRTHSDRSASARVSDANQEPITNISTTDVVDKPRKRVALDRPEEVPEQIWSDWLALRKGKRAPVTQTVLDGAKREAEKAGLPLAEFLRIWCVRGSQGLQADWLRPEERAQAGARQLSFSERDELARRRKWEAMTGQQWPDSDPPPAGQIIDVTPTKPLEIER